MAEPAVMKHIKQIHSSNLTQLLYSESKYNTLTQNQRELLAMFYSKISDKDMAKKLNVTEGTIRRQRFTFREKAKQAHNNTIYVDDRYLITAEEKQHIIETFFSSTHPLVLKSFSPNEKKKVVILGKIAEQFEYGKKYSECEVNKILKPIYDDYMTIRRYLIMYGFMERTRDGRQYWLTNWEEEEMKPIIDHIQITVKDMNVAEPFYDKLMPILGYNLANKVSAIIEELVGTLPL